jgi:hypothetical protein
MVSETIHVHVYIFKQQLNITIFMIIQLINMNIGLREYPVEDWVTALLTQNVHLAPNTQQAEQAGFTRAKNHKTCQSIFPEN